MAHANTPDDVERFMACDQGRRFLEGIRDHLHGQTIAGVDFLNNNGDGISTILQLSNGQSYAFNDEELFLETLRQQFSGLFREMERREKEESNE